MLAPLLLLNAPGEIVSPLGGNFGGGYTAEYVHGWPWVYLYRSVNYDFSVPGRHLPDNPKYGVPWLAWTSWEFWHGDVWKLRLPALIGNFVIGLLLAVTVCTAWEWRRRRRARLVQFTLAESLIAFAIVTAAFGWWWHGKSEYEREVVLDDSLDRDLDCLEAYHGPLWLKRLLGESLVYPAFSRVDTVWLDEVDGQQFLKVIPTLQRLHYLRDLELEKIDPDSEIEFSRLSNMKNLRILVLSDVILSKKDVDELSRVKQLDQIVVTNWESQRPEILQSLMRALPHCKVTDDSRYDPFNVHEWTH